MEELETVEGNIMLNYALRVLTNRDIEDETVKGDDLLKEYKKMCEENELKRLDLCEDIDRETASFYYQFFQMNGRTFGAKFFTSLAMQNPEHLVMGTWTILRELERMSDMCGELESELGYYKELKLTKKQEEQVEELKKKYEEESEN